MMPEVGGFLVSPTIAHFGLEKLQYYMRDSQLPFFTVELLLD